MVENFQKLRPFGDSPPLPRLWFPLQALFDLYSNCRTIPDLTAYGLVLFAIAYGLRFTETISLSPASFSRHSPAHPTIHFYGVKQHPLHHTLTTRPLTSYMCYWVSHLLSQAPTNLPAQPFFTPQSFRTIYSTLIDNTPAQNFPFHSIRRATARYLFQHGYTLPQIAHHCRWRSDTLTSHYVGTTDPCFNEAFILPIPSIPCPPSYPFHSSLEIGTLGHFFPSPHTSRYGDPPPSTTSGRRSKRPRLP
jgi:hypothetical protein